MITVTIGSSSRTIEEADEGWINQQVNGRRRDGVGVCVQVRIKEPGVDVALATPQCPGSLGGGRLPNPLERKIIELWSQRGLSGSEFTGGNVVAFLHQLRRLL